MCVANHKQGVPEVACSSIMDKRNSLLRILLRTVKKATGFLLGVLRIVDPEKPNKPGRNQFGPPGRLTYGT